MGEDCGVLWEEFVNAREYQGVGMALKGVSCQGRVLFGCKVNLL